MVNYTNPLDVGDYFKVKFTYRTYTLNPSTTLECS